MAVGYKLTEVTIPKSNRGRKPIYDDPIRDFVFSGKHSMMVEFPAGEGKIQAQVVGLRKAVVRLGHEDTVIVAQRNGAIYLGKKG